MIIRICQERGCKYNYNDTRTKWVEGFKFCPYCGHDLIQRRIRV